MNKNSEINTVQQPNNLSPPSSLSDDFNRTPQKCSDTVNSLEVTDKEFKYQVTKSRDFQE